MIQLCREANLMLPLAFIIFFPFQLFILLSLVHISGLHAVTLLLGKDVGHALTGLLHSKLHGLKNKHECHNVLTI